MNVVHKSNYLPQGLFFAIVTSSPEEHANFFKKQSLAYVRP